MSKRKLLQLVAQKHVSRLGRPAHADASPACAAAATRRSRSATSARASASPRRRTSSTSGCSSTACARTSTSARRARMAVLRPLKVVITNYPEGQVEDMDVVNNPEDPSAGTRKVPFSREIYIERDDFMEDPPKKFFRLAPGREVRLRNAYLVTCTEVVKDAAGRHRRTALHLRPGHARRRRAGRPQGEGDAPLGVGRARRRRARCASTIGCSPWTIRTARPRRPAWTSRRSSTPRRSRCSTGCKLEPMLAERRAGHAVPVRAPRLLLRGSRLRPRARRCSTAPCR